MNERGRKSDALPSVFPTPPNRTAKACERQLSVFGQRITLGQEYLWISSQWKICAGKYKAGVCCVSGCFEAPLFLLWLFERGPGRCVLLLALWGTWLFVWLGRKLCESAAWHVIVQYLFSFSLLTTNQNNFVCVQHFFFFFHPPPNR